MLALLLIPFCVQAWTEPSLGRELEDGFQKVLEENPEYVSVSAENASVRKQMDELQKKLADRDPELKKLLKEREKLQQAIFTVKTDGQESEEIRRHREQSSAVNKALNARLSKFREYALLSFHCRTLFEKEFLIKKRILFTSPDKRVLNYREAREKKSSRTYTNPAKNLPRADVEGSDEYRIAIYLVEARKRYPRMGVFPMETGCFMLRCKVDSIAENEAHIRKLKHNISLKYSELNLKYCLLQEKNPELAWKLYTARKYAEEQNPETIRVCIALEEEMLKLFRTDPEYAVIEKEKQKLQEEYQKALDDFAAKSDTREAVEYRKVKALLDELDKTVSDSGK